MTRACDAALLVASELAAEEGDFAAAIASLRTWFDVHGDRASPERRRASIMRLATWLAQLADAGGLQRLRVQLGTRLGEDPGVPPLLEAIRAVESARPSPVPPRREKGPFDPGPLVVLWSHDIRDEAWIRVPRVEEECEVRAAADVGVDDVVVHAGRTVRAYDVANGRERWRFPPREVTPSRVHDPAVRHAPADRPVRAVVPAGDLVLVVLGDPPATGSYSVFGSVWKAEGVGEHPRTHLVALDRATGALRWRSGHVGETDPVLGDPRVGCQGPPLVDGERIYVAFGSIEAGAALHACCLHRDDGRLIWRTPLVTGVSGRAPDRRQWGRFDATTLTVLPWGATPALAGGEVCFQPHAGFAAGLDARDGRPRWIRSLARYSAAGAATDAAARRGFGPTNAPFALGDSWILAPHDSPALIAVERGSGRLRWSTELVDPEMRARAEAVRHLIGIVPTANGSPVLRLVGEGRVAVDPRDGALVPDETDESGWTTHFGLDLLARPYADARGIATWRDGGWQSVSWDRDIDPDLATHVLRTAKGPGAPRSGHLLPLREGRWLVVGNERVAVVAPQASLGDPQRGGLEDAEALRIAAASGDLIEAARRARVLLGEEGGASPNDVDLVESALPALLQGVSDPNEAFALHATIERLPSGRRGRWRLECAHSFAAGAASRAVADVLEAELAAPTVPVADLTRALLIVEASDPSQRIAADRARRADVALQAATTPSALRTVARQFPGTAAATRATARCARRALDDGDAVVAAAALADLRLNPDVAADAIAAAEGMPGSAERRALLEADLWLDAHQPHEARNLLAHLDGRIPGGPTVRGRDRDAVLRRAVAEFASWPARETDESRRHEVAVLDATDRTRAASVRTVRFLGLEGPGAARWGDQVPFLRGLELGVIDASAEGATPTLLAGDDLGWFGGTLRALARGPSEGGVLIEDVVAGQPADGSGVASGDLLLTWQGRRLEGLDDFMNAVARTMPGDIVHAEIRRRGVPVLTSFRAGRRPRDQDGSLRVRTLHVLSDGSAVLPCRSGLDRVTPTPPRRLPLWRLDGVRGIVTNLVVRGTLAYVVVSERLGPDRVVAVDLASGTTRWYADVPGRIGRVVATASALVVGFDQPAGVVVLDAFDGVLRQEIAITPPWEDDYRNTWVERDAWAASIGHLYTLERAGDRAPVHLVWTDTTTGAPRARSPRLGGHRAQRDANVAAGAFAAVPDGPHGIVVMVPPLLATGPVAWLQLDATHINSDQAHHGELDGDARLFAVGRHLAVVRLPDRGSRPLTISVLAHDPVMSASLAGTGEIAPAGNSFALEHVRTFLGGALGDRRVLDLALSPDGLAVLAGHLGEASLLEAGWVSFGPPPEVEAAMDANRSLSLFHGEAVSYLRHAPVATPRRWLVPTDAGALQVRAERPLLGRPTPR